MYKKFNEEFSKNVSDYLNAGYQFHTMTMSGHQGEIAKVDLYKGSTMIRIQLDNATDKDSELNTIVLSVKLWKYPAFSGFTAWNSDFTIISIKTWYKVNQWSCSQDFAWYTESKEEALNCVAKHYKRQSNRTITRTVPLRGETYQMIAKTYLKRQGIAQRFTCPVEVAKHYPSHGHVKYRIYYKNKTYQLCIHQAS